MSWMRQRICEGQLAVMLLTRLPAGRLGYDVPKLASAVWFFPSVGIPIGLLVGLTYIGMCYLGILPTLASILAFSIGLIVTGAMHEDGLADCADGFGGGQSKNQKLEIMRDSRIGSFGVLALFFIVSARIVSLSNLPPNHEVLFAVIALAMISRLVMVFYLTFLSPARDEGLGRDASKPEVGALVISVITCIPIIFICGSYMISCVAIIAIIAFLFGWIIRVQIGGQTGDTCGAAQLISETAGYIFLVTFLNI